MDATHPSLCFLLCSAKRDEATQQEAVSGPTGGSLITISGSRSQSQPEKATDRQPLLLMGTVTVLRKVGELVVSKSQLETFHMAVCERGS